MAKERPGNARVRIFYADVEAGNDSTEKILQSVAASFAKAIQPTPRFALKLASPASTEPSGSADAPNLEDENSLDENDPVEDPSENSGDSKRPYSKRKPKTYAFVKDLNLRPTGKQSLREFFEEKKPSDAQEQVTVLIHYLKNRIEVPNVSANHLYTCFKEIGQRCPTDILKVAHNVAHRKGYIDTSDSNNLNVTVPGQNFVEHDLPRNGAD